MSPASGDGDHLLAGAAAAFTWASIGPLRSLFRETEDRFDDPRRGFVVLLLRIEQGGNSRR